MTNSTPKKTENPTSEPKPTDANRSAGNEVSDRSGGFPVPAPDGVDQHNEDPRARAERLGQGDVVNPGVPTGQTPEQMRDELIPNDSNEQFRIAGDKREEALRNNAGESDGRDERGFVNRG